MALSEQLKTLGFSELLHPLVKRICFKPKRFVIGHQVEKGGNILRCQLSFESDEKAISGYIFSYYDAFFQPAQSYNGIISGVDISLLAKKMAEINWTKAFDFSERKNGADVEKEAFENELKVAAAMESLLTLQFSVEGQGIAVSLKQKYWFGISGQENNGMVDTAIKARAEVSQRFYMMDGQSSISLDEAYRYLQNRWLEKELLAKKKQAENSAPEDGAATGYETILIKKRRRRGTTSSKS